MKDTSKKKPSRSSLLNKHTAQSSEQLVASYLESLSWRVRYRNFRLAGVETDLIVESPQGQVCIVEVKHVTSPVFFEARVLRRQKQRLQRAARAWLAMCPNREVSLVYSFCCLRSQDIEFFDALGEVWDPKL